MKTVLTSIKITLLVWLACMLCQLAVAQQTPPGNALHFDGNSYVVVDRLPFIAGQDSEGEQRLNITAQLLLPTATISGTATVCPSASPLITFEGAGGTAPYTFMYSVNGGTPQSISSTEGSSTATLTAPPSAPGQYTYTLLSVASGDGDSNAQTGSAVLTVAETIATDLGNFEANGNATADVTSCFGMTSFTDNQKSAIWYRDSIDLAYDFDIAFDMFQNTGGIDINGMAFVLQNFGTHALGSSGGASAGYYQTPVQFAQSLAVPFIVNDIADRTTLMSIVKNNNPAALAGPVAYEANRDVRITWNHGTHLFTVYVNSNPIASYTEDIVNTIFGGKSKVILGFTAATNTTGIFQGLCVSSLSYHHSLEIKQACGSSSLSTNAAAGSSFVWNTGATTPTITAVAGNTYSVTAALNGCSSTASLLLKTTTAPTTSPAGTVAICPGGSTTLTASAGQQFVWSNNSSSQTMAVSDTGSYIAYVDGCPTAPVQVTFKTIAPVTANYTRICAGHPATLTAPAGSTYLWNTGASTQSISTAAAGDYSVAVTDAQGCTITTDAIQVSVYPQTIPLATPLGTSVCGSIFNYVQASDNDISTYGPGATYTWNSDSLRYNPGGGLSPAFWATRALGTYTLTRTSDNGCQATGVLTVTGAPGDSYAFGNNKWHFSFYNITPPAPFGNPGYDDYWVRYFTINNIDVDVYKGYYTIDRLSFDTRDDWGTLYGYQSTPGFQGCVYDGSSQYFAYWAKRKGFPCGNYTISLPALNDFGRLIINGVEVWRSTGFFDGAVPNVWAGNLNDSSTIEFKVATFFNEGRGSMNFVLNGPLQGLAGNNTTAQQTISGSNAMDIGSDCGLLATVQPISPAPVSGSIAASVWVDATQPSKYVKRHYEITPAGNASTATGKVTLYFTQQEFDDFNDGNSTKLPTGSGDNEGYKTNMLIEKRPGTSSDGTGLPSTYTGTVDTFKPSDRNGSISWNADAGRWEVSFEVTGFSGFFLKTAEGALPLRLLAFTGTQESTTNKLKWETADEVNTKSFELESSKDGRNFRKVATIEAVSTGNNSYDYTDATAYQGILYYRLKMIDVDGTFSYSRILSLSRDGKGAMNIYPNPVADLLNLSLDGSLINSTASLYDTNGKLLQTIRIATAEELVNVKNLSSGAYIIKFKDGSTGSFVKE